MHHRVHRIALKPANLHRLALLGGAHANLLAQHLGGADAGTGAAQRVGVQDGACGAAQVVVGNAADEAGHVDAGGAGGDAGRVMAVQAALGLDQRLASAVARRGIGKGLGTVRGIPPRRADVGRGAERGGSGV